MPLRYSHRRRLHRAPRGAPLEGSELARMMRERLDSDPAAMLERLRPIVMSGARMDELTERRRLVGTNDALLFHRITGELFLAWCVDWPEIRIYIDDPLKERLGLDDDALANRAHENFLADVGDGISTDALGPIHVVRAGGAPADLTANVLMIEEFWTEVSSLLEGAPLIAAAPARDALMVCSATDTDAVLALSALVEETWNDADGPDQLSTQLMLWNEGWSLLDDVDDD